MGLLNIIRHMVLRKKLPIREIARRTGLSRNTIKKYLNAGTIEPSPGSCKGQKEDHFRLLHSNEALSRLVVLLVPVSASQP